MAEYRGQSGATNVLSLVLALAYPVLSHISVALGAPLLQWLALLSFAAVPLVGGLLSLRLKSWLIFALIAVGLWLLTHLGGGQYALYLPPLVFTAALAALFGSSLLKGRTPLISTFARLSRGGVLPDDVARYTRKLTLFWTCLVGAIFLVTLYLTVVGPLWLWSWHTNVFSYVLLGLVFVVEFFLRRRWFAHHTHPSFWGYLKTMTRIRGGQLR